jgi:chemotaxis protein CheD
VSDRDIGKENIAMARQVLRRMGISIVSEDVGGELGRKIVFNTLTSDVAVLKTEGIRKSDWYPYHSDR